MCGACILRVITVRDEVRGVFDKRAPWWRRLIGAGQRTGYSDGASFELHNSLYTNHNAVARKQHSNDYTQSQIKITYGFSRSYYAMSYDS